MDYFKASEVSAAGLMAQKARIEAAASNLANLHTTSADAAEAYRPVTAVIKAAPVAFAQALRDPSALMVPVKADIVAQADAPPRRAYEPGHPHADASGMVAYPGVDHAREMLTVMTALRAYEANLSALQATRTLAAKALEIGGS